MTIYRRLSGENLYHHIYAWGNNRNHIFTQPDHYLKYLNLLAHFSERYKIEVIAYALMQWHIHLFIYDKSNTMPYFMKDLHGVHARYYNCETNRVGHVFGKRYNNKIVQLNNYGLYLSRYIHRQAVEAGIVQDPRKYEWTSYHRFIGLKPVEFVKPAIILDQFGEHLSYQEKINEYIYFVQGEQDDPIDWEKSDYNVVGDKSFCLNIKKINRDNKRVKIKPYNIVKLISEDLAVDQEQLLHPHGRKEKALRHRAFQIMAEEFDYNYNEIAKIFNVTRLTVCKAMTTK